jgi:dihydrodipicolinate synthase/N-acetylneuraminate lyase
VIRGALAAAVTPLRDEGAALDDDAFAPLVDFLAAGGVSGVFALGTTGEGILLSAAERRRAAELFIGASAGRLAVVVHCGAQTTADTVALAAHAAEAGADAVAVIGPPYYAFDETELLAHFSAVAAACAPVPFFVYEFAARAGYAVPLAVVERLRAEAPNLAGLKVSDTPFDAVEPYLVEGLDVFVGSEPLFPRARERGAVGSVSGLATAFPELVAALIEHPTAANG